jgi:hypothetical protein
MFAGYRMAPAEGAWMFTRRGGTKTQARRDEEWRLLVRSITDPEAAPSEAVEARFQDYLGDLGARPRRSPLRWFTRAREDAEGARLDGERR